MARTYRAIAESDGDEADVENDEHTPIIADALIPKLRRNRAQ